MEQLDKVYAELTSLDKKYARSKKSRTEFIQDRFGGNIDVGSFLILNALSAEQFTDPEDIKKLSVVRRILDSIVKNQDVLDSLSSFDFDDESISVKIQNALLSGMREGQGISVMTSKEFREKHKYAYAYVVRARQVDLLPIDDAQQVSIFSRAIAAVVSGGNPDAFPVGSVVERSPLGGYKVV